jgi:hypothetical protein
MTIYSRLHFPSLNMLDYTERFNQLMEAMYQLQFDWDQGELLYLYNFRISCTQDGDPACKEREMHAKTSRKL